MTFNTLLKKEGAKIYSWTSFYKSFSFISEICLLKNEHQAYPICANLDEPPIESKTP